MIKTLKKFAIMTLATGATVSSLTAAPVTYVATNVLQTVTVSLTVYEQKPVSTPTIATGVSFKTKDMLTAVESALGTNGTFDKKAELALLTSNMVTQTGTTNSVTNEVVSVVTNLVLTSNVVDIADGAGATNLTLGLADGNSVTITATNGTTNIIVSTVGALGPTITTYTNTTVTLDANQTAIIGTNAAIPVETNLSQGGTVLPVDATSVVISTNGVAATTIVVGTNTVVFGTNFVTVGTNTVTFTNTSLITNEVTLGSAVIVSNNTTPGLGLSTSYTNSLATTFTVSATNGTTNVTILTTSTDLTTNTESITNPLPIFTTNTSTELVVADGAVNTPVPTNIVSITEKGTNEIIGTAKTSTNDWTVMNLTLDSTAVLTNAADNVTIKLQGLVHSSSQLVTVGKSKVAVTNEAWTDVSGYGTNNGTPIVVGGTISIAAPAIQKIP